MSESVSGSVGVTFAEKAQFELLCLANHVEAINGLLCSGGLKLGMAEYFKPSKDQDLTVSIDRPTLFGHEFDGPMPGHFPGQPIHYDPHVWVGATNPAGDFVGFNPAVTCPPAT